MADVQFMLDARESARRAGDLGLCHAMTADLNRIGYVDPAPAVAPSAPAPERVTTPSGMETASVRAPERAVPVAKPAAVKRTSKRAPKHKSRPALPRCPHGQVEGRCGKCRRAA